MPRSKFTKITITGRPASKKNNARIVRWGSRSSIVPSKAYCAYEKEALEQLKERYSHLENAFVKDQFLHVYAEYWLPDHKWFPDLVNLISATHDVLQKSGIIFDDKFIVNIDGSHIMGFDKENPRADIFIKPIEYDYKEVSYDKRRKCC